MLTRCVEGHYHIVSLPMYDPCDGSAFIHMSEPIQSQWDADAALMGAEARELIVPAFVAAFREIIESTIESEEPVTLDNGRPRSFWSEKGIIRLRARDLFPILRSMLGIGPVLVSEIELIDPTGGLG